MDGSANKDRLTISEKFWYGFGDVGKNLLLQTLVLYLMFYLTTHIGISPAVVGTMMLISKIWDAINDPIMGYAIDNTNTRWGKARPYLLFCSVPLGLTFIMCFIIPDLSPTATMVWLYCAYNGQSMFFTAINISHITLLPRMTLDPVERVAANVYCTILGSPVLLLVPILTPILTNKFAGQEGNLIRGYEYTAIIYGIIISVSYLLLFAKVKERVASENRNKLSFKVGFSVLFKNVEWFKVMLASLLYMICATLLLSSIIFYVTYYLKRPELQSLATTFIFVPMFIGVFFVKPAVARFGKRKTALVALIVCLAAFGLRLITQDLNITLFLAALAVIGFSITFYYVLITPFVTDTIEYGEWKFGVRTESLALSANSFSYKAGQGLGAAIIGYALEAAGFVSNGVQQPATVERALFNLSVTLPLIIIIIAVIIIYSIKMDSMMPTVFKELSERKDLGYERSS